MDKKSVTWEKFTSLKDLWAGSFELCSAALAPDKAAAWELGVVATPALFFYFDGERLRVRRPEREDDDKFVGAATQEQLLEVIRHARHVCAESAAGAPPVLALDL